MEDFNHLDEENMEKIKSIEGEIKAHKAKLSSLLSEIDDLEKEKLSCEGLAKMIQDRVDKEKIKICEYEEELKIKEQEYKENVRIKLEENQSLEEHIKSMEDMIGDIEKETEKVKKICSSGIEKQMVFKGNVSNNMNSLSVKHQVQYTVNGGAALITFQNPAVATKIILAKDHTVSIEECWIHVKAEAVELSILDALRMDMTLSPSKIFVHNLPSDLKEELILDKLELFFAKSRNGGGELEKREFLKDCRSAILTFLDKEVASRLVERKCYKVSFGESSQTVYVAPSLEGNLQKHRMRRLECNRTVLITGIPDITEKDNMRDLLEIHFQKPSHGGGEVQELMYCPEGQQTIAIFEDDEDDASLTE